MSLKLSNLRKIISILDKTSTRDWKVYSGNTRILQNDRTNPRVQNLKQDQADRYSSMTDSQDLYEVRVVKEGMNPALITSVPNWKLIRGSSTLNCRLVTIQDSSQQDLSWIIILARML